MTTAKEIRPAGETGRIEDLSRGSASSLPQGTDKTDWPTPEEIAELVMSHPRARAVNFEGYERGYLDGYAAAQISQEEAADLAAARFYAMEQWEIDNRRRCQIDREWFNVERARAAQGVTS